jgi:penicillin-binding protein 1A
MMAMEDPNAPRLLLLPQDRSFQLGEMTVPSEVAPSVIPPSIPAHVPPGIAPATDPYADERETPATVEDKYQQLLKQYGLSD